MPTPRPGVYLTENCRSSWPSSSAPAPCAGSPSRPAGSPPPSLRPNKVLLVAQEQNLGWDARLRRRYAALILAAALVWSALGLIAGMLIADAMIINTLLSSLSPRWPSTRSRSKYGRAQISGGSRLVTVKLCVA